MCDKNCKQIAKLHFVNKTKYYCTSAIFVTFAFIVRFALFRSAAEKNDYFQVHWMANMAPKKKKKKLRRKKNNHCC